MNSGCIRANWPLPTVEFRSCPETQQASYGKAGSGTATDCEPAEGVNHLGYELFTTLNDPAPQGAARAHWNRTSEGLPTYREEEPKTKETRQEIQSSQLDEELSSPPLWPPPVSVPARLNGLTPRIATDTATANNNLNAIKNFRAIDAFSKTPSTQGTVPPLKDEAIKLPCSKHRPTSRTQ